MGRNPSIGGFRRDKIKNWLKSFPRTTRKGYGKDATARLKDLKDMRIQDSPFLKRLKEIIERIPKQKTPPNAMILNYSSSKRRKLKGKNFNLKISFHQYIKSPLQVVRIQKKKRKKKIQAREQLSACGIVKRIFSGIWRVVTPTQNIGHEVLTELVHL
jgi:hypothetical protein